MALAMWEDPWNAEPSDGPAEGEPVLVAVINRPEDWARVQAEHWYRIPLSRAPRQVAARYLAFYHTAALADLRWTIAYYAPVERYTILTRRELLPAEADHPRADDLYYKIEIGPLCRLSRPIPSQRLRRVTFIRTTLGRLLAARELNDLWLREDAQAPLRRALRLREVVPLFFAAARPRSGHSPRPLALRAAV